MKFRELTGSDRQRRRFRGRQPEDTMLNEFTFGLTNPVSMGPEGRGAFEYIDHW
jgi:hypothetical protein